MVVVGEEVELMFVLRSGLSSGSSFLGSGRANNRGRSGFLQRGADYVHSISFRMRGIWTPPPDYASNLALKNAHAVCSLIVSVGVARLAILLVYTIYEHTNYELRTMYEKYVCTIQYNSYPYGYKYVLKNVCMCTTCVSYRL